MQTYYCYNVLATIYLTIHIVDLMVAYANPKLMSDF